jgi:TetR/AcrR family transcriptional regulator
MPKDRDTEARILAAARTVFIRRGTSGARLQEIAAEAGVNQALLHYYFGSKDELAERVFIEAAQSLMPAFAPNPVPGMVLEDLITAFVQGYIDAVRQAPFIPFYVLSEATHHPERLETLMRAAIGTVPREIANRTFPVVERMIAERVAQGTMRPMNLQQLMVNVMALTVFPFVARPILSAALELDDEGFQRFLDQRREDLPRFILNALRP